MAFGKIFVLGATALSAIYAHSVLACEMRPKSRPSAEAARKSGRLIEITPRVQRPVQDSTPILSRRLILQ